MNEHSGREDTAPIQAIQVSEIRGQFGLWRLQHAGQPSGKLVASLGRVAILTIGRESDNSLVIDDITVSRHHCRIVLDESGVPGRGPWVVDDLNARNGTWVGLERLAPGGRATIHTGQTLRVGAVLLWLGDGNTEDLGPISQCMPGFSLSRWRLIRQLSVMLKRSHSIIIVGPHGSGRRKAVSCMVRSLNSRERAMRLSPSDPGAWQQAAQFAQTAPGPMALVVGPLEALAPEVQREMAQLIALRAAAMARGEQPNWYLFGWASPSVLPFASPNDPLLPELRQALHGSLVEFDRLDLHREDLPAIVEDLRSAFLQPSLQELARIDNDHAAEVCAQVQRWIHQRWPGELAEVASMALPNHQVEEALSHGLPPMSGSWMPQPVSPSGSAVAASDLAADKRPHGLDSGGFGQGQQEQTRHVAFVVDSVRNANWFLLALSDPTTLWNAIQSVFAGNIRAFCDEAGAVQGRNPESVRRQVYRLLGDRLRTFRS